MRKTKFYQNAWFPTPFAIYPNFYFGSDENTKELILRSTLCEELGVSSLELDIIKFTAIDELENEHYISDFKAQNSVSIKGMAQAHYLKSTSILLLPKGVYTKLRFYLGKDTNKFVYSNGDIEIVNDIEFLDFKIENKFKVDGKNDIEIKLWFDLVPLKFFKQFKFVSHLFYKLKGSKNKLVNQYSR